MFIKEITSTTFKEGDRVYHTRRKQEGIFRHYDDRNSTINDNAWVWFEDDDEELMVSLHQLEKL